MNRLHPNLAAAVVEALVQVFVNGKQADTTVSQLFIANRQWGARDRRFVAENVYDLVRYWRKFSAYANMDYRAITPENIRAAAAAKWLLDDMDVSAFMPDVQVDFDKKLWWQDEHSFSDELMELFQREAGPLWKTDLTLQNEQAAVCLRANTLKTSRDELMKALSADGAKCTAAPDVPDGVVLDERKNLTGTDSFRNGWFEVQDLSSQQVAPACRVSPGMKVIDCCAGAGGKTLHLAALMQNKGELIAADIHQYKLEELKLRAARAGAAIIQTTLMSDAFLQQHTSTADRVLIDAPCTGSGTLRRKPDAKWRITRQLLDEAVFTQQHVLNAYSPLVKHGGLLVYATCSVFESENEEAVFSFLDAHSDFSEQSMMRIPVSSGFDGFFIAVLKRN